MSLKEMIEKLKLEREDKINKNLEEDRLKQTKQLEIEIEQFKELFHNKIFSVNTDEEEAAKKLEEILYENKRYGDNRWPVINLPFDIKVLWGDYSLVSPDDSENFKQWKEDLESFCGYKIVFYNKRGSSNIAIAFYDH